tara:strand:- start:3333 stop:3491 length:159 start_codon:yes stop_codon:yes gene_type:complete
MVLQGVGMVNSFSFLDPRPHYQYLTKMVGIKLNLQDWRAQFPAADGSECAVD